MAVDGSWSDFFGLATTDATELASLQEHRKRAGDLIKAAGYLGSGEHTVLKCKAVGLDGFPTDADREVVAEALGVLAMFGLFVVPVGVLENWLKPLGVTNKQTWVTEIFKRLGSRGSPVYVEPGDGDAWQFVEGISEWLLDQNRAGMLVD